MKKFLILLSLLFVTVCYAAPPPAGADLSQSDPLGQSVLQYETEMFSIQELNVQEVAYVYLGSLQFPTGYAELFVEPLEIIRFAEIPVIWVDRQLIALNKPPSFVLSDDGVELLNALKDKQHTNYGYPLTADRCHRGIVPA